TGELDSRTGDEIYRILRRLQRQRQTTLVVVTHDRRFITPSDLVLEIQDGKLANGDDGHSPSVWKDLADSRVRIRTSIWDLRRPRQVSRSIKASSLGRSGFRPDRRRAPMCPASIRQSVGVSTSYQGGSRAKDRPVSRRRPIVCARTRGVLQSMASKIGGTG